MNKIVTTFSKYDLKEHKIVLGIYADQEGNEYTYQPERSKREDSIPEYGAEAPLSYDEWEKRCGALNIVETQ